MKPIEPLLPARYRTLFLDTMNSDLARLESAIASHDLRLALQILHRMSGALLLMRMAALSASVHAIEEKLIRGGPSARAFQDASGLVRELRNLLVQV
ncbi:Hpt domain-containing protein [Achromobacter sp. NPDC058515]|uniref:Hpt domain-containing protein n=1 Tax=Achromobacter sp. NPDC058515 TaxID=3346533 RepID=UPI0036576FAA